jgi:acyl-CoA thioester hydrolase
MTFDFARPGRMDDLLEVETRVKEVGGASVRLEQTISRDGVRLVTADVIVVLISMSGKPLRISASVREAFEAHSESAKNLMR